MEHFLASWGYVALFAITLISAFGIPIGSEVATGYAGALASGQLTTSHHHLSLVLVIVVAVAGEVVGSTGGYLLGRFGGRPVLDRVGQYVLVTHADLDRAEEWFARRGEPLVFFGRLVPLLRSFVSLAGGIGEMAYGKFLVFTIAGSAIYCAALASIGYSLGASWHKVIKDFSDAGYVVAAVVVVAIVVVLAHRISAVRAERGQHAPGGGETHGRGGGGDGSGAGGRTGSRLFAGRGNEDDQDRPGTIRLVASSRDGRPEAVRGVGGARRPDSARLLGASDPSGRISSPDDLHDMSGAVPADLDSARLAGASAPAGRRWVGGTSKPPSVAKSLSAAGGRSSLTTWAAVVARAHDQLEQSAADGGSTREGISRPSEPPLEQGVEANARLTGMTAAVLLVLLAIEGLTIVRITSLLTLHVVLGMILVPIVLVKVGSTTWKFARYYLGDPRYRRRGPPPPLLRLLGPFVVVLTFVLLGSGIALLVVPFGMRNELLLLHKVSFVLWFAAMVIHVLGHLLDTTKLAPRDFYRRTRRQVRGATTRQWLIVSAAALGILLGVVLAPQVGPWLAASKHGNHVVHRVGSRPVTTHTSGASGSVTTTSHP